MVIDFGSMVGNISLLGFGDGVLKGIGSMLFSIGMIVGVVVDVVSNGLG